MVLYINPYCCVRCFACEKVFHHVPELAYEGVHMGHWIMHDEIVKQMLKVAQDCPGRAMRIMTETEFKMMMEGKSDCQSRRI